MLSTGASNLVAAAALLQPSHRLPGQRHSTDPPPHPLTLSLQPTAVQSLLSGMPCYLLFPLFVRTRSTSPLFDVVLVVNHRVLFCEMCKSFREPTLCLLLSIDDTADDTALCYVEEA